MDDEAGVGGDYESEEDDEEDDEEEDNYTALHPVRWGTYCAVYEAFAPCAQYALGADCAPYA